jgi:glycosyltransferase involved in cell wall biosynthesis
MKILWHSNAPWCGTGYGMQTELWVRLLTERGHEVVVSAYHGLRGARLNAGPVRILPGGNDAWGNDLLAAHYEAIKPDVLLTLMDIWVLEPQVIAGLPLTCWCPVDHEPLPPVVETHLRLCKYPIAMSRFGEQMMRAKGLDPFYVPHGVDTEVFKPCDRAGAREAVGMKGDGFMACCVAANQGNPSRKNLDLLLKAWAQFSLAHPEARLYIHTDAEGEKNGLPLPYLLKLYEIDPQTVIFPDQYALKQGGYPPAYLNRLYNAADVFVLPSAGEGFGIPIVEAQASGCPVIVTDFSAMSELCFDGWLIEIDEENLHLTLQNAEQARPDASAIYDQMECAFDARGNDTLRIRAREGAREYDAKRVLERHMLPVLECIAEMERA